jgi:hypothetical protein
MQAKRFQSPNSFNFPLLTQQDLENQWFLQENQDLGDDADVQNLYGSDLKFGKRNDEAAFETFLGSRG